MQQDLTPISGSTAAVAHPTAQFHLISFNSPPYYSPFQNPNLNSNYGNAASNHVDIPYSYLPAAATIAQQPPNSFSQQYAKIPLRNTNFNQINGSQKRFQWKNKPPRKIKVMQSFGCEVCKVDCNSESVRDLHYMGNKHKKNMQKLDIANSSNPLGWCEVCKVEFTSKIVLDQHNMGKRHKKNMEKLDVANSNVPLAWCEVCQTNYNSKIVLDQHLLGKKHKKNYEKLIAANPSTLSASVEATSTAEERPQKKQVCSDDLETKKRKMLQQGVTPEAVHLCSVCNVICNSVVVFKYHLAGKKHSAMVKKHESAISSAAATEI